MEPSAKKRVIFDYGYFGVLGADFDENGSSTGEYQPKKSYYALQNLCAVFAEVREKTELPVLVMPEESSWTFGRDLSRAQLTLSGFTWPNGSSALVYWTPADLMTTSFEGTVSFQVVVKPSAKIHLIDLMGGAVYELPENMICNEGDGCISFKHIPVKDYPLLLYFDRAE